MSRRKFLVTTRSVLIEEWDVEAIDAEEAAEVWPYFIPFGAPERTEIVSVEEVF